MRLLIPFLILIPYLRVQLECDILLTDKRMEVSPIFCLLTDRILDLCSNNTLSDCLPIEEDTREYLYRNFGIKLEKEIIWINVENKDIK